MAEEKVEQSEVVSESNEGEKKSGRDEKGLTLLGRQALRVYAESMRVMDAIGSPRMNKLFKTKTFQREVKQLVLIAAKMTNRVGKHGELLEYLAKHQDADREQINAMMDEELATNAKEIVEIAPHVVGVGTVPEQLVQFLRSRVQNAGKPCGVCQQQMCGHCGTCHHCAERKTQPPN